MKRIGLLNAPLSHAIATLGHTQALTIADAGLPIPAGPQRIDLAVTPGLPSFLQLLDAVAGEMMVERAVIASEMATVNPSLRAALAERLDRMAAAQGRAIALEEVAHEEFKRLTVASAAVVRTGECSPYANILLYSGVTF
ncbi:high affinity ribose transport protein (plasmid) [Azospirillum sp. B510]|uniref:D-ribose pyranase n=1 Tax=Azospirillum sp. (strain B510) TaxID=137722 RepID=UPI0001C4C660|nr:D-ribose pyranase [Azospirillum sp. B510]BAI75017.1 high affinity ribose transport protein [Azospirillum sp. B510]